MLHSQHSLFHVIFQKLSLLKCYFCSHLRPLSTLREPSTLFGTLLHRWSPYTHWKLTIWSRGNSIWWKTGTMLGGVSWLSDCGHSGTEMRSSILQITSSMGFIFVLELILNIPLCSPFITYCPLLLASTFITGDLSHTSFLSVTLFIVRQGF